MLLCRFACVCVCALVAFDAYPRSPRPDRSKPPCGIHTRTTQHILIWPSSKVFSIEGAAVQKLGKGEHIHAYIYVETHTHARTYHVHKCVRYIEPVPYIYIHTLCGVSSERSEEEGRTMIAARPSHSVRQSAYRSVASLVVVTYKRSPPNRSRPSIAFAASLGLICARDRTPLSNTRWLAAYTAIHYI